MTAPVPSGTGRCRDGRNRTHRNARCGGVGAYRMHRRAYPPIGTIAPWREPAACRIIPGSDPGRSAQEARPAHARRPLALANPARPAGGGRAAGRDPHGFPARCRRGRRPCAARPTSRRSLRFGRRDDRHRPLPRGHLERSQDRGARARACDARAQPARQRARGRPAGARSLGDRDRPGAARRSRRRVRGAQLPGHARRGTHDRAAPGALPVGPRERRRRVRGELRAGLRQ